MKTIYDYYSGRLQNQVHNLMKELSIAIVSNDIVLKYKNDKFSVAFYRFGALRTIKDTQSDNPITSLKIAVEISRMNPVLEIMSISYQSMIVYDVGDEVEK